MIEDPLRVSDHIKSNKITFEGRPIMWQNKRIRSFNIEIR